MNLHDKIMNIQQHYCVKPTEYADSYRYAVGHRDARHAAAELALKYDGAIEEALLVLEQLVCVLGDVGADGWTNVCVHKDDVDALVKLIRTLKSL